MGYGDNPTGLIFRATEVYPSLAAGVTVTDGGGAWGLGALSNDIIAAAAVPNDYVVDAVAVENISAADDFELVLYHGAGDVECARIRFDGAQTAVISCHTPLIPGGDRLKAKVASATGGRNIDVSVQIRRV